MFKFSGIATMKAVVCKELGLPEKLVVEDVPSPKMGIGDVRIKVAGADVNFPDVLIIQGKRSEEHTSELQSLMRISYAVFCLKKKKKKSNLLYKPVTQSHEYTYNNIIL